MRYRLKALRAGLGPFGGEVEVLPDDRELLNPLFELLRDRRELLYSGHSRRDQATYVTESIQTIRGDLTQTLQQLHPDSDARQWVEKLRAACREYLTAVESETLDVSQFEPAIAELRAAFFEVANHAAALYRLPAARELATEMQANDELLVSELGPLSHQATAEGIPAHPVPVAVEDNEPGAIHGSLPSGLPRNAQRPRPSAVFVWGPDYADGLEDGPGGSSSLRDSEPGTRAVIYRSRRRPGIVGIFDVGEEPKESKNWGWFAKGWIHALPEPVRREELLKHPELAAVFDHIQGRRRIPSAAQQALVLLLEAQFEDHQLPVFKGRSGTTRRSWLRKR